MKPLLERGSGLKDLRGELQSPVMAQSEAATRVDRGQGASLCKPVGIHVVHERRWPGMLGMAMCR